MLTFEWIVLVSLLVIGMISGLAVLRTTLYTTCTVIPENAANLCEELVIKSGE